MRFTTILRVVVSMNFLRYVETSDAIEASSKNISFSEKKHQNHKPCFFSKFPTEISMNRTGIEMKTFLFIHYCNYYYFFIWRLPLFQPLSQKNLVRIYFFWRPLFSDHFVRLFFLIIPFLWLSNFPIFA